MDANLECFHRPGRVTRRGVVTCRNCGAGIEYCPCVGETFRHCVKGCRYCWGSMWVALVRSRLAKLREVVQRG
jgi:hypothetical protein